MILCLGAVGRGVGWVKPAAQRAAACAHSSQQPPTPPLAAPIPTLLQSAVAAAVAEKDTQLHAAQDKLRQQLQGQLQQAEAELEVGVCGGGLVPWWGALVPTHRSAAHRTCACLHPTSYIPTIQPTTLLAHPLQATVTATVERKDAELADLRRQLDDALAAAQVRGWALGAAGRALGPRQQDWSASGCPLRWLPP